MKKLISALMSMIMVLSMITVPVMAEKGITVTLDGKEIVFDVQPQLINERTMVPLRAIFEALDVEVFWDQDNQTVTSIKDNTTVKLTIGEPYIKINQQIPKELDCAPCIINERTLVPVRAISEAFHMNVDWDGVTQTVLITSPNVNMSAYNKLKNNILFKGEKSSYGGGHSIYYKPKNEDYSLMLAYYPEVTDELTIYYNYESVDKDTVMISIYPDMNPSVYYKVETNSGNEYTLYANYPKPNYPFVETNNDFPVSINPCEKLDIHMEIADNLMYGLVGMSFADFGIYYKKQDGASQSDEQQSPANSHADYAFYGLASSILDNGEYNPSTGHYYIAIPADEIFSMLTYDAENRQIIFSVSSEEETYEFFQMIEIKEGNEEIWGVVTAESYPNEYKSFYKYIDGVWVMVDNSFPNSLTSYSYDFLITALDLMDATLPFYSDVKLADFGITY